MSGTAVSIFSGSVAATSKTITWAAQTTEPMGTCKPRRCIVQCTVSARANGIRLVEGVDGLFHGDIEIGSREKIVIASDSGNLGQTDVTGIY